MQPNYLRSFQKVPRQTSKKFLPCPITQRMWEFLQFLISILNLQYHARGFLVSFALDRQLSFYMLHREDNDVYLQLTYQKLAPIIQKLMHTIHRPWQHLWSETGLKSNPFCSLCSTYTLSHSWSVKSHSVKSLPHLSTGLGGRQWLLPTCNDLLRPGAVYDLCKKI